MNFHNYHDFIGNFNLRQRDFLNFYCCMLPPDYSEFVVRNNALTREVPVYLVDINMADVGCDVRYVTKFPTKLNLVNQVILGSVQLVINSLT